ncbi:hypothetical protein ACFWN2_42010 [Lentzea sp. NPDC058436]|uniref:hypothetical protein n=1 Tax=Lentzea sp. NPDC058436 TaxID=3346499 RepID=UPI00364925D2
MSKTKDLTVRERLIRAGILLPAPRLPESGVPEPRVEAEPRGVSARECVGRLRGGASRPHLSM